MPGIVSDFALDDRKAEQQQALQGLARVMRACVTSLLPRLIEGAGSQPPPEEQQRGNTTRQADDQKDAVSRSPMTAGAFEASI